MARSIKDNFILGFRKIFSGVDVRLLAIGMENSKSSGACEGAEKDARTMFNLAKARCERTKLLLSADATKANVIREMTETCKSDLAIIFFSGHGGQQKARLKGDEADGKDELIGLYDQTMLDNEIWNIVSNAQGRVFTIFDCCHSETMYKGLVGVRPPSVPAIQVSGSLNLLCWSACADNTYAYGDNGGGMLTNAIYRNFSAGLTYDKLWDKLTSDKNLAQFEAVRRTVIGASSGFSKKKIFS